MLIKPRDYQREAVKSLFEYFKTHKEGNPVIAMPTGTGKSVVIADFCELVTRYFSDQKILVVTHVKELVEQDYDKLIQMWPQAPCGIYSAGLNRRDVYQNIIFAGIASIAKRAVEFGHVDLIIVDEAHRVNPNDETQYKKLIDELTLINPKLRVIGLTATPWRLGHGRITDEGGLFTDICYDLTTFEEFNKLLARGFLCPLYPKQTKTQLDVSGVHKRGGEFIPKELQAAVDKEMITRAALEEAIQIADNENRKCWLIFASGVEHAIHIRDMLNEMGVSCRAIHSSTKDYRMTEKERDKNIAEFKQGRFTALVNNNVLTTGFDHPNIDLIVGLRPTSSVVLWGQMLGRGTRVIYADGYDLQTDAGRVDAIKNGPKPNCLVLDYAGNTKRLGPINDPVIPKKKGKEGGDAPVKECEQCNTLNHASVRECMACGAEFTFKVKFGSQASTDDLIKGDLPIINTFKIDHITYGVHNKAGGLPSMKVTYYSGLKRFTEYICVQQSGPALRKAKVWWEERSQGISMPDTAVRAVELSHVLMVPTHLRVWTNKQYPEILAHCYDGTDFGERVANGELPKIDKQLPVQAAQPLGPSKNRVSYQQVIKDLKF